MNLYILSDAQRTEELCILIIFFLEIRNMLGSFSVSELFLEKIN